MDQWLALLTHSDRVPGLIRVQTEGLSNELTQKEMKKKI